MSVTEKTGAHLGFAGKPAELSPNGDEDRGPTNLRRAGNTGRARSRPAALRLAALVLAIGLTGQGCGVLRWMPGRRNSGKAEEREVHALPLVPDVDFVSVIELGNERRLYRSDRDLLYAEGDRFYPIVVRGYPQLVGPSPAGSAVAFLEPSAFEMVANLYVFDVTARTLRQVTAFDNAASTLSVKSARWYDDRTLYFLQGYRYGTVSHGGDLWRVDLQSLECTPIVRVIDHAPGNAEIVDFEFVPGHKLIRYVVSRYDDFGGETRRSYYCSLDGKPVR